MITEIKADSSVSIKLKIKCSTGLIFRIPFAFSPALGKTWDYIELTLSAC